ncbi:MAG: septum formation initiator family protein [Bacilli bacterium]|nr:septum formation initiator family protein [Bacilli bacterium]
MSKKMPRKAKKRLIVFGIPCILIIFYFFFQLFFNIYKIYDLKLEQHRLNTELNNLKKEEKEKRNEIEKYETEDGMGGYIRKQYSYSKNNEYIIKLNDSDKSEEKELTFSEYLKKMISNINIDYPYIIVGSIVLIIFIIIITSKKKN